MFGKGDALIAEYVAPFIPDACRDAGDDVSGSIDAFVPAASAATRLELVLDGVVVDTFASAAAAPPAVSNIRGSAPAGAPHGASAGVTKAARTGGPAADDADAESRAVVDAGGAGRTRPARVVAPRRLPDACRRRHGGGRRHALHRPGER